MKIFKVMFKYPFIHSGNVARCSTARSLVLLLCMCGASDGVAPTVTPLLSFPALPGETACSFPGL